MKLKNQSAKRQKLNPLDDMSTDFFDETGGG